MLETIKSQFHAVELAKKYKAALINNNAEEQLRQYYQSHLYEYIIKKFNVRETELQWSLLPEYENHDWDGDKDPLFKIINCVNESKWCGVESGKGVGKTWLIARLVFAFLDCFKDSIVVTVAPKEEQLKLHAWKEISKLYPLFNKGKLLSSLKLRMYDDPEKAEQWTATGFGVGTAAIEQVALNAAGFHGKDMLVIFEEMPGINQKVIDSFISTSGAPHNIILAFGNPDHQLDNLHKFCKLPNVEHIRISGYDFPNVVLDNSDFIPGAQSKTGLERLLSSYGSKSNPLYLSHARGISPGSSPDSLIQAAWIEKAQETYKTLFNENGNLDTEKVVKYNILAKYDNNGALGVDVANSESGDKAAWTYGVGVVPVETESFPCPNSNQLAHKVNIKAKDNGIDKKNVNVDGIGVGAGTVNTLIDDYGYSKKEIDFQSSGTPIAITGRTEQFNNLRSQAWWMVREGLRTGLIPMPNNPNLISDLMTPLWSVKGGKICIEAKVEIKKRIGRSPNDGDSFVYWFWKKVKVAKPISKQW